jgi:hypothetical protein
MAKQVLASGTISVNVCKDTFKNDNNEEQPYFYVEIPLDDELGIVEHAKLKAPSSYGSLARKLRSQTSSSVKINKSTE